MSGWSVQLQVLLDEASAAFGIEAIRGPEFLDGARQTGFVWTARPGVVCLAGNRKYMDIARANPCVSVLIAPPALARQEQPQGKAMVVCERAEELYHHLHLAQERADSSQDRVEVASGVVIDPSAILRGHVRIGAGTRIGPRVVLSGPVSLGRNVQVDAGAIIGCEGLYAKTVLGVRRHIPHFGGVEVADDAFVHAGAVIVRSAIDGEVTRIGRGAHVGIMTNVGHDVQVGDHATLSSNVVIAGRAKVGARAWVGASATISNMVQVGEGAEVIQDVPHAGDVSGNFALPHGRNMKRFLRDTK